MPLAAHPVARGQRSLRYLVSNPPYIPDHEWDAIEPNVKDHEPHVALRGGADGLEFIRPIIAQGTPLLESGGVLAIEVASSHAEQAAALASEQSRLRDVRIIADCDGLPRVIWARAE
jgi:release factor glutamine methyltransferase